MGATPPEHAALHQQAGARGGGGGRRREMLLPVCLLAESKEDKRSEVQVKLLAGKAAWRGYRTSTKAASVTGKRGSACY